MLEWNVVYGDDKLKKEIKRVRDDFEDWYSRYWKHRCSREAMLSDNSPVQHVSDKITKSFEEVKVKYPYESKIQCSSCCKYVESAIETSFSFCDEYECGMSLCKKCAIKLKIKIEEFIKE